MSTGLGRHQNQDSQLSNTTLCARPVAADNRCSRVGAVHIPTSTFCPIPSILSHLSFAFVSFHIYFDRWVRGIIFSSCELPGRSGRQRKKLQHRSLKDKQVVLTIPSSSSSSSSICTKRFLLLVEDVAEAVCEGAEPKMSSACEESPIEFPAIRRLLRTGCSSSSDSTASKFDEGVLDAPRPVVEAVREA